MTFIIMELPSTSLSNPEG